MKSKLALLLPVLALAVFAFFGTSEVKADEASPPEAIAYLINDQTGEKTQLNVKDVSPTEDLLNQFQLRSFSDETNLTKTYEVFTEIPDGTITTFDSSGGNKTGGGVTAKINVNYDISGTDKNKDIRVNSYNGSWTPSSKLYVVGSRVSGVHSGLITGGKNRQDKPTSNSFSYKTGWGYNVLIKGGNSPRAWMDCKISVSGMSGTSYTLSLEVTFP